MYTDLIMCTSYMHAGNSGTNIIDNVRTATNVIRSYYAFWYAPSGNTSTVATSIIPLVYLVLLHEVPSGPSRSWYCQWDTVRCYFPLYAACSVLAIIGLNLLTHIQ